MRCRLRTDMVHRQVHAGLAPSQTQCVVVMLIIVPDEHQPVASQVTGGLAGPHGSTSTVLAGLLLPAQQLWTHMVCHVRLVSSCTARGDWRLQSSISFQARRHRWPCLAASLPCPSALTSLAAPLSEWPSQPGLTCKEAPAKCRVQPVDDILRSAHSYRRSPS